MWKVAVTRDRVLAAITGAVWGAAIALGWAYFDGSYIGGRLSVLSVWISAVGIALMFAAFMYTETKAVDSRKQLLAAVIHALGFFVLAESGTLAKIILGVLGLERVQFDVPDELYWGVAWALFGFVIFVVPLLRKERTMNSDEQGTTTPASDASSQKTPNPGDPRTPTSTPAGIR